MEKQDNTIYDIILMLQPTSPSRTSKHIVESINLLEKSQLGIVEYHLRLQKLETEAHTIKTKLWLVALISGAVCSTLWELIKARFLGRHI
jgi:hypothetical protein